MTIRPKFHDRITREAANRSRPAQLVRLPITKDVQIVEAGVNTDLFEIIRTTRSMRRLKPDPVPPTLIRQIIEAGTSAPNGGNMQTWRFLLVRDPAIKSAVAQWYRRGGGGSVRAA